MRGLFALVVAVLISACGGSDRRPAGILDDDKFKEVLLEAQLIEAKAGQDLVVGLDHSKGGVSKDYEELFARQGITEEQFDSTFAYYRARPLELKALYEEVLTELGKRKDELPQ